MYVALLCGGIVRVLINTCFYKKLVGGKITKNTENTNYKIKDRKFLMLASIGDQTIEAAPTVITTTLINLAASSVFSVYSMVYLSMKTLVNSFHHAVSAIFGNMVVSSDDDKISKVFDALLYVFVMLGTLLASCCAYLFMDFINLYASGFTEGAYVQPVLACFIAAYIAIFSVRTVMNFVSHSCGLFRLTCKATLVCGCISLIVSVFSTVLFGMPYVMVGVLLYHFSTMLVLVYYFKKEIKWFKINPKWVARGLVMILLPMISWVLQKYSIFNFDGWFGWLASATIYSVIVFCALLIYTFVFDRKAFSLLLEYVKKIFKNSKNKTRA